MLNVARMISEATASRQHMTEDFIIMPIASETIHLSTSPELAALWKPSLLVRLQPANVTDRYGFDAIAMRGIAIGVSHEVEGSRARSRFPHELSLILFLTLQDETTFRAVCLQQRRTCQ